MIHIPNNKTVPKAVKILFIKFLTAIDTPSLKLNNVSFLLLLLKCFEIPNILKGLLFLLP